MKNEPDSSINIPTSMAAARRSKPTLYLASQSAGNYRCTVLVLLTPRSSDFSAVRYSAARQTFGPHRLAAVARYQNRPLTDAKFTVRCDSAILFSLLSQDQRVETINVIIFR